MSSTLVVSLMAKRWPTKRQMQKRVGDGREGLASLSDMSDLLAAIAAAKNVVVVAGAGISVSCGIPDFRSAEGLYNTLQCAEIGLPSPELLFDLEYFLLDPEPFYKFAHMLLPPNVQPSVTHRFVAELQKRGKLLRMYTQNIDQLERKAEITRVVECHGSIREFKCTKCKHSCSLDVVEHYVHAGTVATCPTCRHVLKPGITFFSEGLPREFDKMWQRDQSSVDLVIVMGTSLKVGSMMKILEAIPPHVPLVLLNRDSVTLPRGAVAEKFDLELLGACDDIIQYLMHELGWTRAGMEAPSYLPRLLHSGSRRYHIVNADDQSSSSGKSTRRASEAEGIDSDIQLAKKRAKGSNSQSIECRMCNAALMQDDMPLFFECTQCDDKYLLCRRCYSR